MEKLFFLIKKNWILGEKTIYGIGTGCFLYLAFAFSTLGYTKSVFWCIHLVLCVVACAGGYLFYKSSNENAETKKSINIGLILSTAMIIRTSIEVIFGVVESFLFFKVVSQLIFWMFFIYCEVKFAGYIYLKSFFLLLKKHRVFITALIVSSVLLYDPCMMVFKYDGMLYYSAAKSGDLYSLSSLSFYGHMAQSSGALITFFRGVAGGDVGLGTYLANCFAMVVGGCYFYAIIRKLINKRSDLFYTILSSIYLFSPYILGMGGYLNVDYFCTTFFLPVIYYTITEEWMLQILFGIIFACTKEPGIIIYAGICLCILIKDFMINKWKILNHSRYYGMALLAFLWMGTLLSIGFWNAGNSSVEISFYYIRMKLAALFTLNFSWYFALLIIIEYLFLYYNNKTRTIFILKSESEIWVSIIVFTLFSVGFKTVNHARYTDIIPISMYLLFAIGLAELSELIKSLWIYVLAIGSSGLMLLSTYCCIDPASKIIFNTLSTYDGRVLSLADGSFLMGDHMIYNKQALWIEGAYSAMIEDSVSDGAVIIIPAYNNNTYYFDGLIGQAFVTKGDFFVKEEYWDKEKRQRANTRGEGTIPFEVYSVIDMDGVAKVVDLEAGKVFIYAWVEGTDSISDTIKKEYSIIEERNYKYRDWVIDTIRFKID